MKKIVNTVLCLACLGYVSGVVIKKQILEPADPTAEVLAYMNELDGVLRELGIDPDAVPASTDAQKLIGIPVVVVGDESVAEVQRRVAAERYQQLLTDARAVNATTAARPEPGIDYEVRMPQFAPVTTKARTPEDKDFRNPASLYEQSRHYRKYGSFGTKLKRKNRGRVVVSLRR